MGSTNVAHLAHIGGFFLCFAVGRVVAKGGPSELDDSSTSPYWMGGSWVPKIPELGSLHPWENSEYPLNDKAKRVMDRLLEEGDEFVELAADVSTPAGPRKVIIPMTRLDHRRLISINPHGS